MDDSGHEASKVIKELAAKQKIEVRLTAEQMDAISKHWGRLDPHRPAEITFFVDDKAKAQFKVAAYSYHGDSCCA
jgi:hypothetical protein